MEKNNLSDEQIVQKIQSGDKELLGVLIDRYEQKITRYGRRFLNNREDIKDSVQDVFIKAYKNICSFDISKKFSSWIYRIAHNEFINNLRKRRELPFSSIDLDAIFPHINNTIGPEEEVERFFIRQSIENRLAQLKQKYKEPLVLYYMEEMSYQEIADILQIPVSTVGIRLKRGREKLRQTYKNQEQKNGQ